MFKNQNLPSNLTILSQLAMLTSVFNFLLVGIEYQFVSRFHHYKSFDNCRTEQKSKKRIRVQVFSSSDESDAEADMKPATTDSKSIYISIIALSII